MSYLSQLMLEVCRFLKVISRTFLGSFVSLLLASKYVVSSPMHSGLFFRVFHNFIYETCKCNMGQ